MKNIFVVGSINRDLVAYVQNLPKPSETVFAHAFQQFPGGKGANQAVAAQRLGGKVRFVGNVGDDAFGEAMMCFLQNEKIDVAHIKRLPGVPTGIALITVDAAAENSIIVISGANMEWQAHDIESIGIGAEDIVVCQFEIPLDVIEHVFLSAKHKGATTILNPAPIQPIPKAILNNTDYIIVNEIELSASTDMAVDADDSGTVQKAAEYLRTQGAGTVIATLGSRGVVAVDAAGRHRIQGRAVAAVDSTGAGDCFIGAFVSALSRENSLRDALEFANKAAAISVTRQGASPSFPAYGECSKVAQNV